MAFCVKCGAKLEEGAKFCTACAAPVENPVETPVETSVAAPVAAKPLNKKLIGIIAGAAVALVALVLILVLLPGGADQSSPEAVAETYVEELYGGNIDVVMDCWPDFYLEHTADQLGCEVADLKDMMTETFSELTGMGIDIKVSATKIEDEGDDLDELASWIGDAMSAEEKKSFEGWAKVEVTLEFKGQTMPLPVQCICLDGVWYVISSFK